jgi:uncharacterized protein YbcI
VQEKVEKISFEVMKKLSQWAKDLRGKDPNKVRHDALILLGMYAELTKLTANEEEFVKNKERVLEVLRDAFGFIGFNEVQSSELLNEIRSLSGSDFRTLVVELKSEFMTTSGMLLDEVREKPIRAERSD